MQLQVSWSLSRMSTFTRSALRSRVSAWLYPAAGYAISLVCLVWVYRGFDWKSELPKLASADWRWITVAVLFDLAVYFIQGWRWRLLLMPVARPSLFRTVQAVFVGLFANEILPFRSGELVRGYAIAKWSQIPYSVALSSVAVERLFDGLWLVLGFYLIRPFLPVPGYIRDGGAILAGLLVVLALALGGVMFRKQHAHAAVSASRWSGVLFHVVEGLHAMGSSPSFYAALAVSFLYLALQVAPIYALMRSFDLDLPFLAAVVVLVILRLGTILPQAPGNVGGFQFFAVVGLRLFDVDKSTATSLATIMFVVVTVPLWVGGLIAIATAGVRLKDLHKGARSSFRTRQVPVEDPKE